MFYICAMVLFLKQHTFAKEWIQFIKICVITWVLFCWPIFFYKSFLSVANCSHSQNGLYEIVFWSNKCLQIFSLVMDFLRVGMEIEILLCKWYSYMLDTIKWQVLTCLVLKHMQAFFQIAYEVYFWSLCNVTFWQKFDFLISNVS